MQPATHSGRNQDTDKTTKPDRQSKQQPKAQAKAKAKGQELIEGKTFEDLDGVALFLQDRQNVTIRDCVFNNVGVPIRMRNCRNVTIESCHIKNIGLQGIDMRHGCSDIRIINNHLQHFQEDKQGGHFISAEKTDEPQQFRITISGNRLIGSKKSWVRGRPNGASADMMSLRSLDGFTVRGNTLVGGGEFGMTCVYGSRNGIISENTIRDIDGTGLLIGYDVRNINVHGNNIIDAGSSFETDGSKNDIKFQSGIHCRNNVKNVLIVGNLICREKAEEMRYGIQLRETSGMIHSNLIAGVDKKIHIPKTLADSVKVDFGPQKK